MHPGGDLGDHHLDPVRGLLRLWVGVDLLSQISARLARLGKQEVEVSEAEEERGSDEGLQEARNEHQGRRQDDEAPERFRRSLGDHVDSQSQGEANYESDVQAAHARCFR